MSKDKQDGEYRAEADRLRLLGVQTQKDLVAMHRHVSRNPKVPKQEREDRSKRAAALERLLGLAKRTR